MFLNGTPGGYIAGASWGRLGPSNRPASGTGGGGDSFEKLPIESENFFSKGFKKVGAIFPVCTQEFMGGGGGFF